MAEETFWWLLVTVGATLGMISMLLAQAGDRTPIYLDPNRPVEERVDDLMSRMTLKEKVGQLNFPDLSAAQMGKNITAKREACKRFTAGTYIQDIGPGGGFYSVAGYVLQGEVGPTAEFFNELQETALTQTRLRIPLLQIEEAPHGAMFSGATVFREGLAIGSSFDIDLVRRVYAAAAAEARAVGINILSTLVLELDRDPRMGRNEEA